MRIEECMPCIYWANRIVKKKNLNLFWCDFSNHEFRAHYVYITSSVVNTVISQLQNFVLHPSDNWKAKWKVTTCLLCSCLSFVYFTTLHQLRMLYSFEWTTGWCEWWSRESCGEKNLLYFLRSPPPHLFPFHTFNEGPKAATRKPSQDRRHFIFRMWKDGCGLI
jgi:hypothetical protein